MVMVPSSVLVGRLRPERPCDWLRRGTGHRSSAGGRDVVAMGPRPAIVALALVAALGGCGASPPAVPPQATSGPFAAPTAQSPAPLGEVTLALGERLAIPGGQLSFDAVIEDSRCPADAQCIWAGRVVVAGTLTPDGADPIAFSLGLPGGITPDAPLSQELGPLRLTIVDVAPYPATSGGPAAENYTLTLRLERA